MSNELSDHYQKMWVAAREKFETGQCEIDPWIDHENDDRNGITLLARPNKHIRTRIVEFQNGLQAVDPYQYYYPATDFHLTVLSIISCYRGFSQEGFKTSEYSKLIRTCLKEPIEIHWKGVTASPEALLIQGFPSGNSLDQLRGCLRNKFKSSSLEHSIDRRYRINTGHITAVRFRKPLVNPEKMIQTLTCFRDFDFGKMTITKLHLVNNDWYQRKENVTRLNTFAL